MLKTQLLFLDGAPDWWYAAGRGWANSCSMWRAHWQQYQGQRPQYIQPLSPSNPSFTLSVINVVEPLRYRLFFLSSGGNGLSTFTQCTSVQIWGTCGLLECFLFRVKKDLLILTLRHLFNSCWSLYRWRPPLSCCRWIQDVSSYTEETFSKIYKWFHLNNCSRPWDVKLSIF